MKLACSALCLAVLLTAADAHVVHAADPIIGRWDLTVKGVDSEYPSWLEVRLSGNSTLVGSFVGQFGSARPVAKVERQGDQFRFVIPPQWENRSDDIVYSGTLKADRLLGETTDEQGRKISFEGLRAPELPAADHIERLPPIELFNGKDLVGWRPLLDGVKNGWVVVDGLLTNQEPGNNLATVKTFDDFDLRVEFRYPQGSNSGVYLRGRYELQIEDNYGGKPDSHHIGGIYGFLRPSVNAAKRPDEWQVYEVTLSGRTLTAFLNGERVIDRQEIPGITGGALDSREGEPGPIYLQGDHGPVQFRRITLTPHAKRKKVGQF